MSIFDQFLHGKKPEEKLTTQKVHESENRFSSYDGEMVPEDVNEEWNHEPRQTKHVGDDTASFVDNSWETYGEEGEVDMDDFEKKCIEDFGTADPEQISAMLDQEFESYLKGGEEYFDSTTDATGEIPVFEEYEIAGDTEQKAPYDHRKANAAQRAFLSQYEYFLEKFHPEIYENLLQITVDRPIWKKTTSINHPLANWSEIAWDERLIGKYKTYLKTKHVDPQAINEYLESFKQF